MKKFLALILALIMALSLVACGGGSDSKADADTSADTADTADTGDTADAADFSVAMITDYGDITDQFFNQTTFTQMMEIALGVAVRMAQK